MPDTTTSQPYDHPTDPNVDHTQESKPGDIGHWQTIVDTRLAMRRNPNA